MDENAVVLAHLTDCARRAARSGRIMFSNFLDPAQAEIARQAAAIERVPVELSGGHPDAERNSRGVSAGRMMKRQRNGPSR